MWNSFTVNVPFGDAATKDVGTTEGTVAAGDDPRIEAINNLPKFIEGPGIAITELGEDFQIEALAQDLVAEGVIEISPGGAIRRKNLNTVLLDTPGDHVIPFPDGVVAYYIEVVGAGGGGGGGRQGAAGTTRSGGGGGQAGGFVSGLFYRSNYSLNLAVKLGAGGAGGAGGTSPDTNGANGGAGGESLVGASIAPTLRALGGAGGIGGSTGLAPGGGVADFGGLLTVWNYNEGVPGSDGGGEADAFAFLFGIRGTPGAAALQPTVAQLKRVLNNGVVGPSGGGGGISAANAITLPSAGSNAHPSRTIAYGPGAAGTPASKNAASPTMTQWAALQATGFGVGGSGGAASLSGPAGHGSDGSPRGGGGGGGGASLNGNAAGNGGKGGDAYARIVWL